MNPNMLAAHFDNWIFLLLVAVAMLFRWLSSAAGKASKSSDETPPRSTSTPPSPPSAPGPRRPIESDTDRMRKFLEALGQPPGTRPPPSVAHRTDIPPRPVAPVRPPSGPLPFSPKDDRRSIVVLQETPTDAPGEWLREAKVIAPVESAAKAAEVFAPSKPVEAYTIATPASPTAARIDIVALLGSAKGLRDAIILREIFGPPRSLRPLDSIGSA